MRYGICAGWENAEVVKASGFDYIELSVSIHLKPLESENPVPEIQRHLKKAGIPCESMNIFMPGNLKIVGPEADQEKLAFYLKVAGERSGQLGVKTIVFGSGGSRKIPDGFPKEKAEEQVLWFMKKAGDILASHQVTLALEPLGRHDCNFIQLVSEGADYVKKAAHPSVKLLADSYHMAVEGEPWDDIPKAGNLMAHAHVADPHRKPPGETDYDYRPFLGALKAAGYQGRVSIESEWKNMAEQAPKALKVLRESEK